MNDGDHAPQDPRIPQGPHSSHHGAVRPNGNPYVAGRSFPNPYVTGPVPGQGNADTPPLWAPWYGIGFGKAIVRFFRKTFYFHGRASRGEYWWAQLLFILLNMGFAYAAYGIGMLMGISNAGSDGVFGSPLDDFANNAQLVPQALLFVSNLSLSVRRLHDENRRGWWVVLPTLLQFVGLIAVVVSVVVGNVSGDGSSSAFAQTMVVAMLLCFGALLMSVIISITLMIGPSNPLGTRFDRPGAGWGLGRR
ncbi:DUF805 domain-containing protein [Bifidobacterium olomucense]|uniref:DUF805 domain-containing protein n=1 Tax=Bifidobacterium olomucense TaxID=2675324 RepID=A0A7Y0EXY7_9BIFI|nr:DUF805 domain-containing protein [Bifidobacterium sp. DSM 109959]NMM98468.1 hypothetical protein [Bifidobacterium sp. DSM 109959]